MDVNGSLSLQQHLAQILKTGRAISEKAPARLDKIEEEWNNLVKGKPVNQNIVPRTIYESWQRSMEYGVDPYSKNRRFLSKEEIKKQILDNHDFITKFGDILLEVQSLAREKGLSVQIFDSEAKTLQLIAHTNFLHRELGVRSPIPAGLAENEVGTNAACIALRENKSVQVLGPEHFNFYFHNFYCSAAPIHNSKGEVIGAINISSYSHRHTIDTLMLVTLLAKTFDSINFIMDTMGKLDTISLAMNSTIDYLPHGMVYVNNDNEIEHYNDKIVEMLGLDKSNIKADLAKYISTLQNNIVNDSTEKKEIYLDVNGRKKLFLVSTKKILNHTSNEEKIIFIENAKNSNNRLQGNYADYTFSNIIGKNKSLWEVKSQAKIVAKSSSPVLIFGESGTGKELFAQAIHNESPRKNNPFVAINCGALPHDLVESELFGYESGAFTGASKNGKPGKLEVACGGTLFLDEIENMPVNIQIKLLRALSTNKICRIGGIKEIPIDIRLISATKKDLLQEADEGNFREDLYYRIGIITLKLPALRERDDDIPILAKHFIDMFCKEYNLHVKEINKEFFEALTCYSWRGNIRELRNVIERAIVLLSGRTKISLCDLPEKIVKAYNYKTLKNKIRVIENTKNGSNNLMKMSEEIVIELLLSEENGNLSKTAERLGISRTTLYNKINSSKKLKMLFSKHKIG
ncbi:Acetoin dehydrogenase operon transcriptional activator AcoR [Pelotomaculum sp. FP]|uniref:sigma-54 interaction domain-containing protein n=1 Tax=Pelotomaculum sp. FP TaxID=261474 RepID=UPI0010646B0F|nr:sigma 54-interacting transcriptional regulator [Pelotomaculum sp. FP]TEB17053.1 Acetoin dehydrogenase operon transcriptional activator AcoR [Pelotomaculum sp. FP]